MVMLAVNVWGYTLSTFVLVNLCSFPHTNNLNLVVNEEVRGTKPMHIRFTH